MSYRNKMVEEINEFYREGFKTREGRITKLQKYISSFCLYLKADLTKSIEHKNSRLAINVYFVDEGKFAEIIIEEMSISFIRIRKSTDRIEVNGTRFLTNDYPLNMQPRNTELLGTNDFSSVNVYRNTYILETLKTFPNNIDEKLDTYLMTIFKNGVVSCID